MEGTLPAFWVSFTKSFLLKIGYSYSSKVFGIWTFQISVFVNMTNIVVKSYTLLYMCVEVMICQSDRSLERLMISQIPSMGGHQNTSGGRGNVEETLPTFGVSSTKTFLLKIGYS